MQQLGFTIANIHHDLRRVETIAQTTQLFDLHVLSITPNINQYQADRFLRAIKIGVEVNPLNAGLISKF